MHDTNDYNLRLKSTCEMAQAMLFLLADLGLVPYDADSEGVVDSGYATGIFDAFIRSSRFEADDVIPREPDFMEPGYPSRIPVMWDVDAAVKLRQILLEARRNKGDVDLHGGVEGFVTSMRVFIDEHINGDAADRMVEGARKMIPLSLDWNDTSAAGQFGDYLGLPKRVVTHHTRQMAHVAQISAAIQGLQVGDVDESLIRQIKLSTTLMNSYVLDLGRYFFEQYSLAKLHTERVQNGLFKDSRDNRVWVVRLALNVSQMSDLDPTGKFADFVLQVMDEWLEKRRLVKQHAQSAEKTTFQLIVEKPDDAGEIFRNFERDFKIAMLEAFARRHGDLSNLSEEAKTMHDHIHRFAVRGTAVTLPFDSMNVLGFAIQEADDVETFYDILRCTDIPPETLEAARDELAAGKNLEDISRWFDHHLKTTKMDIAKLKAWVNAGKDGGGRDSFRGQLLQAFVLQSVYYNLKYLSSIVEYFEKERSSVQIVQNYGPEDLAQALERDGDKVQEYLANNKYVSDGRFDPLEKYPELLDEAFMGHLPHLRALLKSKRLSPASGLPAKASRILAVWDRMSHEWGHLTHSPRPNSPGGAQEVFWASIDNLEAAWRSGDAEVIALALSELKAKMSAYSENASYIWSRAIADPKNSFFLKRDSVIRDHSGNQVPSNVYLQEQARLAWTHEFGAEADSIQQYLKTYSRDFDPDFEDEAFQSVWSIILEVVEEWRIPLTLVNRPAGDFVMNTSGPLDINGVAVDNAAFVYEVWARIQKKYADKPYHDVKKVHLSETELRISDYDDDGIKEILERIADEMHMQTVPFLVPDKKDKHVLYVPTERGWKTGEVMNPGDVIEKLRSHGVGVDSFRLTRNTSLKRLKIYSGVRDGDGAYRYSNFPLNGRWEPFMKTLSITTAMAFLEPIFSPQVAEEFDRLKDELAETVESEKEANFPRKAGFAIHPSMAIDAENVGMKMDEQWSYFKDLAVYLNEHILGHIEGLLPTSMDGDPKDSFRDVHALSLRAKSKWVREFIAAISRWESSNTAILIAQDHAKSGPSGEEVFPECFSAELRGVISARSDAIRTLGEIKAAFDMIMELANEDRGVEEFTERDLSTARLAVGSISGQIRMFRDILARAESRKPGGLPGGGSTGGATPGGSSAGGDGSAEGTHEAITRSSSVDALGYDPGYDFSVAGGVGMLSVYMPHESGADYGYDVASHAVWSQGLWDMGGAQMLGSAYAAGSFSISMGMTTTAQFGGTVGGAMPFPTTL